MSKKETLNTNQFNNTTIQSQTEFIKCLTSKYDVLFVVDGINDTYITYKIEDATKEQLSTNLVSLTSAEKFYKLYVSKCVYEADKEKMYEFGNYDYINRCLAASDSISREYRVFRNEKILYYQIYISKFVDDTNTIKFLVGFSDIDDIVTKYIEEERERQIILQEANEKLEVALNEAKSAANAKSTFLFNMSHDIRTPMNAILGFADVAEKHSSDSDKVLDCISKIKTSGDYLLKLINDVLDMARIESGKVILCEEPMNLYESNNAIINMYKTSMEAKNITFVNDVNIQNPYVYGDLLRLEQIVSNLMSNALKFTKPGGTVEYHFKQISEMSNRYATYEIRVKDSGIGMTKEFQTHLFEQFERERNSTVSGIEGTGLGMAITKSIVDLLAGGISVNSELGKGTEFVVHFNLKIQSVINTVSSKFPLEDINIAGYRVLLVEDNELNRELATVILEDLGLIVDTAQNGIEAVEKVKKLTVELYDVILMDIQMPLMNGYEAARTIRSLKNEKLASIPIIALSANAFDEDKERSLVVGMNAHIAKPLNNDELIRTINDVVNNDRTYIPVKTARLSEYETKINQQGLKGGYLIYENSESERILYASDELISMFACSSFDEFKEYTGNSFRGIVYSEDLERVEYQIKEQIAVSNDKYDFVSYRIKRKDNQIRLVEDMGHLEKTANYGDVFHVYISDITVH